MAIGAVIDHVRGLDPLQIADGLGVGLSMLGFGLGNERDGGQLAVPSQSAPGVHVRQSMPAQHAQESPVLGPLVGMTCTIAANRCRNALDLLARE